MSQAVRMVDALDTGIQGNSVINFPKALKRGWARPGGENAPRIPIPWPQDFHIGQGRKPRLLFDELDIHQFVQGTIAIIEREDDLVTVRAMLAQLRVTMRDAQFHGFESARYVYGTILSLLEDGTMSWTDSQRIADERRAALIARGPSLREQATNPQRYRDVPGTNARGGGGRSAPRSGNNPNIPNFATRACVYYNQGVCAHRGDDQTGGFLWKHVCRKCFGSDHVEGECPLLTHSKKSPCLSKCGLIQIITYGWQAH
jgi:hypothetical protein